MAKNPTDNRYRTGGTPVFYWKDGTKLRLTDRSALPAGALVISVFESIDKVPQSVIDEIAEYNTFPITLTQYQSKNKTKITDNVKVGKIIGAKSLTPTAKDPSDNGGMPALFTPIMLKSIPFSVIKMYSGVDCWVGGHIARGLTNKWWSGLWPLVPAAEYYPIHEGSYADPYHVLKYRVIDGVAISGEYRRDFVEVIENIETRIGADSVVIPELKNSGVYTFPSWGGGWYVHDNANYTTYVGMGQYDSIMNNVYETSFDTVINEGGFNTYNLQLGANYLTRLHVGVKVDENAWCLIDPVTSISGNYVFTQPPEVIISGGEWIGVNGQPYVFPTTFSVTGSAPFGAQKFDGTRHFWNDSYGIGRVQVFAKKRNEILHLSFNDDLGVYCDFNTSDSTNYHMSKVKKNHADYNVDVWNDLIIPANAHQTIEVVLIPAKWKYFVWAYGHFNNGATFIPKWLTSSFTGSPPLMYGHAYANMPWLINDHRLASVNDWPLYYNTFIRNSRGTPIDYTRWSHISTPEGITYGPVHADPAIEDRVFASMSYWLRMQSDEDGRTPQNPNGDITLCNPGYSAWVRPRQAGQLVAIIRVVYVNGAIDHRYVYAKTTDESDPILKAYAETLWTNTKNGAATAGVAETWYTNWTTPPLSELVVENTIDTAYVTAYQSLCTLWASRRLPGNDTGGMFMTMYGYP